MSAPARDEIEDRLRALPATLVVGSDDERAIARLGRFEVPDGSRATGRRRMRLKPALGWLAAFAVAVVLLNIAGVYFAPAYGRALADTPGIGPASSSMLRAVGLSTSDVVGFNDSATSNGHTVRLVGGYADALRTELFLEIDGRGMTGNPKAFGRNPGDYGPYPDDLTLSDQFGHRYDMAGVNGGTTLGFQALAWPASSVGARLTLHLSGLIAIWELKDGPLNPSVRGDWTLHATLVPQPASRTTLPPPLRLPGITYTFTSIRASGNTLSIHFSVAGAVVDRVTSLQGTPGAPFDSDTPFGQLWGSYFPVRMFDAAGVEVQMADWGYTFPRSAGLPASGSIDAYINGPGTYGIQFGQQSSAQDLRWIVVS